MIQNYLLNKLVLNLINIRLSPNCTTVAKKKTIKLIGKMESDLLFAARILFNYSVII
jgi:hypothetical protein